MKLHIIETGYFKLDGGAMFGVVPKTMWSKKYPADEYNLCTWQMRCLLVEDGNRKILIDTGMGSKQDAKFRSHFHPFGEKTLQSSLADAGFSVDDVTDVLLTHLHFDHVGGALELDKSGNIVPTFSNAKYWSNDKHWKWAIEPNAREAASFLKENIMPLQEMGILELIDVEEDIKFSDNISLNFAYGHTEALMAPTIHLPSGKKLIFTADLLPSPHHISMPWVMGYDVRPLVTLDDKAKLYEKVVDQDYYIFYEHDKDIACSQIVTGKRGRPVMGAQVNIEDLV